MTNDRVKVEPAVHEDDIEAVCSCLEDDAAGLRLEIEDDERADTMVEAAATIRSLCKQLDEVRDAWRTVERDGLPPCDGHTTYIGINSAGYACCFNAMRGGTCIMETAEGAYRQMSDLRDWRLLDRPAAGTNAAHEPQPYQRAVLDALAAGQSPAARIVPANREAEVQRDLAAEVISQANLASKLSLPPGYEVVAQDVHPSTERGSWTCRACGFRGFWSGGPHCMWTGAPNAEPAQGRVPCSTGGGTAFQQRPVSGRIDFPASPRHPVEGVDPRQADSIAAPLTQPAAKETK